MWLLNGGWASKMHTINKRSLNSMMFVGPPNDPQGTLKKSEIKDYLDDDFMSAYNVWQKWHMGFGLPMTGAWAEVPKHIIDVIEYCEIVHKGIERFNKQPKK